MPVFDTIAQTYDQDFTLSRAGILQRDVVINYLDKHLPAHHPFHILELGCGTGEDAVDLAGKGHNVIATDISAQMIEQSKKKASRAKLSGQLQFEILDMQQLGQKHYGTLFNLIYTNFGALNCLSEEKLADLFKSAADNLEREGRFIGVVMPRYCFWESIYFILKGRWSEVFRRRKRDGVPVRLGTSLSRTWYYSPRDIRRLSGKYFEMIRLRPVGFFLPPSYLDPFFNRKLSLLNILKKMEKSISGCSLLSGSSDHFIFELKRKE